MSWLYMFSDSVATTQNNFPQKVAVAAFSPAPRSLEALVFWIFLQKGMRTEENKVDYPVPVLISPLSGA